MKKLKICFVGVGSIAKRHIRNLVNIAKEDSLYVKIDVVRRNADMTDVEERSYISNVYTDLKEIGFDYDAIFITNPTDMHMETLSMVQDKAKGFFIEKPLTSVQKLGQIEDMSLLNDKLYYVACPLRYHPVIQYLKDEIINIRVVGVQAVCSSYLPEWRKGIDYRYTYSAQKKLGGGVSIDLIHEWDYLQYIFGRPCKVTYCAGKKSDLEIDCDDTAIYIAEYKDKFLELHLDYFGRKSMRQITIFTDEDTINANLLSGNVSYMKSGKEVLFDVDRDDFQKLEIRHFLELLGGSNSDNGIWEAYQTMKLTQGII